MGRIGAFGVRRGMLLGLVRVLALAVSACFRPPRPPQPPQAAFTVSTAPMVASFSDQSTGAINTRSWDFGDGATSSDQNPTHMYAAHGDYSVTLTVTGPGGTDSETQTVAIKPPAPIASFTAEPPSGTVPLTVVLTNTSTGFVDSVAWDLDADVLFDDATGPTASQTFTTAGDHTVGLSVTGPGGTATTSRTIPVSLPPPPIAVLRAQPTSGVTPLIVSLNGCASAGEITTFAWDFDSNGTIDQTGPWHDGAHLQLTRLIHGQADRDGSRRHGDGQSDHHGKRQHAVGGTTVTFIGTANDAEDGSLSSLINWSSSADGPLGTGASIPVSTLSVGSHTITASVTDSGGVPATSSINITVTPATPVAGFTRVPAGGGFAPLTVNFTDTSTGTVTSRSWSFGDGGTSTAQNPSHTYGAGGLTITLTVTGPGGSDSFSQPILVASPGDPGDCGGRRCEPPPDDCIPPVCDPRM
jgi:PKD repeat protein